ncbi:NusG domain II-containing protein [Pseudothermotoga sp.]|nr:NusG domain II-containing protein [Pseudothermotoga sp.]MCX7812349.1 NusG domain II-containing protein [Pseudothermotoga sp.]MDW8139419.1 NusG domain II-containing protein [Pseudothermotoga sp.]
MNNQNRVLRKLDILLITALTFIFLVFYLRGASVNQSVEVLVEGKTIMQIKAPGSYELRNGDKYLMKIVFDGYKVHVEDSNCPLKICEKTGSVKSGGTIICVPNRVLIKFKKSTNAGVDVMTW